MDQVRPRIADKVSITWKDYKHWDVQDATASICAELLIISRAHRANNVIIIIIIRRQTDEKLLLLSDRLNATSKCCYFHFVFIWSSDWNNTRSISSILTLHTSNIYAVIISKAIHMHGFISKVVVVGTPQSQKIPISGTFFHNFWILSRVVQIVEQQTYTFYLVLFFYHYLHMQIREVRFN